jgi:hypothetical protein
MPTISVKISGMDDMEDFEYLSDEEADDFVERMIEAGILIEDGFDEELLTSQEELLALNPLLDNVYFIEEEAGI